MRAELEDIFAACDEIGQCRVWRLGTNADGLPIMRPSGTGMCVSVRRLVYRLLHPAVDLAPTIYISPSCGTYRCLSEHCLCAMTRRQYMRAAAERGAYKNPLAEQKISIKARARTGRTIDDVRAIRSALAEGATRTELAKKYGVSIDTISNIGHHHTWRDGDLAPNASVFNFRA